MCRLQVVATAATAAVEVALVMLKQWLAVPAVVSTWPVRMERMFFMLRLLGIDCCWCSVMKAIVATKVADMWFVGW
jgi:hypothetical protein